MNDFNAGRAEGCDIYQCHHAPQEVRSTMKTWICQECHDEQIAKVDKRWEFTLSQMEKAPADCHLIIDGKYYIECGYKPNIEAYLLGYGGRIFHIEHDNGNVIMTNNLWNHGTIPDRWRDRLPDNARFI